MGGGTKLREYSLYFWEILWGVFFLLGLRFDCIELLGNKGIHIIGNQYYRFFTGLLIHVNLFHTVINMCSLYWVSVFLHGQIDGWKLLLFSTVTGTLTNILFSFIYPDSTSVGGSPVVFSLIGFIVILQFLRPDLPRFQTNTTYAAWIIGYGILGNLPVFSKNISTLVIHSIAFFIALVVGYLSIGFQIL